MNVFVLFFIYFVFICSSVNYLCKFVDWFSSKLANYITYFSVRKFIKAHSDPVDEQGNIDLDFIEDLKELSYEHLYLVCDFYNLNIEDFNLSEV